MEEQDRLEEEQLKEELERERDEAQRTKIERELRAREASRRAREEERKERAEAYKARQKAAYDEYLRHAEKYRKRKAELDARIEKARKEGEERAEQIRKQNEEIERRQQAEREAEEEKREAIRIQIQKNLDEIERLRREEEAYRRQNTVRLDSERPEFPQNPEIRDDRPRRPGRSNIPPPPDKQFPHRRNQRRFDSSSRVGKQPPNQKVPTGVPHRTMRRLRNFKVDEGIDRPRIGQDIEEFYDPEPGPGTRETQNPSTERVRRAFALQEVPERRAKRNLLGRVNNARNVRHRPIEPFQVDAPQFQRGASPPPVPDEPLEFRQRAEELAREVREPVERAGRKRTRQEFFDLNEELDMEEAKERARIIREFSNHRRVPFVTVLRNGKLKYEPGTTPFASERHKELLRENRGRSRRQFRESR